MKRPAVIAARTTVIVLLAAVLFGGQALLKTEPLLVSVPPIPTARPPLVVPPRPTKPPVSPNVQVSPLPSPLPFAHYRPENAQRYAAYAKLHPETPAEATAALVNSGVDLPHYSREVINIDPHDILVMCNKVYGLPAAFEPHNLRPIAGESALLVGEAANAFETMRGVMRAEGLTLVVQSGYRSYAYQKDVYARVVANNGSEAVADTVSARPGHSEHQTGLTLDVLQVSHVSYLRAAHFEETEAYRWLCAHAHEYGFILRYPEADTAVTGYEYEPWHWRYVGVTAATEMVRDGIATLEEYVGRRATDR